MATIIRLIKKQNKPTPAPRSYRPIALTYTMYKLLEKMINKRLLWNLQTHQILSSAQSGFRLQQSIADNLVILQTNIINTFQNQQDAIPVRFHI